MRDREEESSERGDKIYIERRETYLLEAFMLHRAPTKSSLTSECLSSSCEIGIT